MADSRRGTRPQQGKAGQSLLTARTTTFGLLLGSLFLLGLMFGGMLQVKRVEVVGTNLPVDTIGSAAGVTGENIFAVRSDDVVRRLASIPSISVDHVSTAFPDRVVVYASLRPAVAAWKTTNGLMLVSADGTPLTPVKTTKLPVIEGGSRAPSADMLAAMHYAIGVLPAAPDGALAGFTQDDKGLAILGQSGWRVDLGTGSAQALGIRVATLKALLKKVADRGRQIKYADLRFKQPYMILR